MSARTEVSEPQPGRANCSRLVLSAVAVIVLGAIALDTKVVRMGSEEDVANDVFSPAAFGTAEFPRIQASIVERAVDAKILAEAVLANKATAAEEYGVKAGIGSAIPVSLDGVVGEGKSGIYDVSVEGVPEEVRIRVQTGPAINGTELRDATGDITFGQFTNQIEFQNAGAALNNEMKKQVLAGIDNTALTGKTVSIVGVFTLINPKNWLVTPVKVMVQ